MVINLPEKKLLKWFFERKLTLNLAISSLLLLRLMKANSLLLVEVHQRKKIM